MNFQHNSSSSKKKVMLVYSVDASSIVVIFSLSDLPPEHNRIDLLQVFNIFLCNHFASWFFERNKCLIQWRIINTNLVPEVTFCYIMPFGSKCDFFHKCELCSFFKASGVQ